MRKDGIFIGIEVDNAVASDPELAARLEEACPVDIYARGADGGVDIVEANIDECVLCRLCLDAAPPGTVKVIKLYDHESVLA
ncbi:MAG TPA: ferredoxin family protein [Solirubrobacteraceae bacterium]|jgi:NAD-dependent dihydropyrimidine dehydrogenase PreA subunit|nr:ferredoxin family protein [Solirubrobacteraceae bacterium]